MIVACCLIVLTSAAVKADKPDINQQRMAPAMASLLEAGIPLVIDKRLNEADSPATTFLFDRARTGRLPFCKGAQIEPELVWRFELPSFPLTGPESSPVFDKDMNSYFGAHDGCFYSLTRTGILRWMFKTRDKIYSSSALFDEKVVVCSGDGHCFCFGLDGTLLWSYDAAGYFKNSGRNLSKRISLTYTKSVAKDQVRGKPWTTKCWSSPCISEHGIVYITCYGTGLHALDIENGKPLWTYDLGSPRNHLSGVALNEQGDIFVASQRRYLHSVSAEGKRRWRINVMAGYDAWGNPSIDCEEGTVYFSISRQEADGYVVATDYSGTVKWKTRIDGGVRGSVAVSRNNFVLVGGLNGRLYFLDKHRGTVIRAPKYSDAERGLWTTPSIDSDNNIFLTVKETRTSGGLYCIDEHGQTIWKYSTGKTLSTPVIDEEAKVYIGTWNGEFLCLQT
ncbi:MAG: outer membrane protein assembly factor BamB [Arenicella sp.]